MDIEALEQEIAGQLQAQTEDTNMQICVLPENIADFKPAPTGGCRLTVGFNESNYKEDLMLRVVSQPDEITLIVSIQSRTLRGTYGVYTMKKMVETALIGFTPNHCDKPITGIYFGPPGPGMDIVDDQGGWNFVYHIRTRSMLVQVDGGADAPFMGRLNVDKIYFNP